MSPKWHMTSPQMTLSERTVSRDMRVASPPPMSFRREEEAAVALQHYHEREQQGLSLLLSRMEAIPHAYYLQALAKRLHGVDGRKLRLFPNDNNNNGTCVYNV